MEKDTPFTFDAERVHRDTGCSGGSLGELTTDGAIHVVGTQANVTFCRSCIDSDSLEALLREVGR